MSSNNRKNSLLSNQVALTNLALAFANSVFVAKNSPDMLSSWNMFRKFLKTESVLWNIHRRTMGDRQKKILLDRAITLRKFIREILLDLAQKRKPSPMQIKKIHRLLAGLDIGLRLEGLRSSEIKIKTAVTSRNSTHVLLAPIVLSLGLLIGNFSKSIKKCANTKCVILFIDKKGRRKWCSMRTCGNRAKVALYARRHRTQK